MSKKISRRKFIKVSTTSLVVTGAGVALTQGVSSSSNMKLPNPYEIIPEQKFVIPLKYENIKFFDKHQHATVATIANLIIPSDDTPGAIEAGAVEYIDSVVANVPKKQKIYSRGLKWIDEYSQSEYGSGMDFIKLGVKQQIDLLKRLDDAVAMRKRYVSNYIELINRKLDKMWDDLFGVGEVGAKFFIGIRDDVFHGYYSNPIIWKIVGYYGPPQPNGYPKFAEAPLSSEYNGLKRPVTNATCKNCHYDQNDEEDHEGLHECNSCHSTHDIFK